MGVSTNVYTVYGVKTEWDDKFAEEYDDMYDDKDLPFVILDGMGGDYMIFGVCLHNSGDFRWGELNDGIVEYSVEDLPYLEKIYRKVFGEKFPDHYHLIDREWKILALNHYS